MSAAFLASRNCMEIRSLIYVSGAHFERRNRCKLWQNELQKARSEEKVVCSTSPVDVVLEAKQTSLSEDAPHNREIWSLMMLIKTNLKLFGSRKHIARTRINLELRNYIGKSAAAAILFHVLARVRSLSAFVHSPKTKQHFRFNNNYKRPRCTYISTANLVTPPSNEMHF